MQRFYFNVRDGAEITDETGTLLKDEREARVEAVVLAGSLLKDHGDAFWNTAEWRMDVTDERGTVLFTLKLVAEDNAGG